MDKGKRTRFLVVMAIVLVLLLVSIFVTNKGGGTHESIKTVMRDAVIHEENKMNFFGLTVNPSLVAGYIVSALLLFIALMIRIFAIPRFKTVPGKFQMVIEMWVGYFDNLAKTNSPHLNKALGAYTFAAGSYIFLGTIFELFGIQWMTTNGHPMALPAPLCDINGAIAMGVFSYGFIMSGGIRKNKVKGVGLTLKGVFTSNIHELPSFLCTSVRNACYRAGLLHNDAQFCTSCSCRCTLYTYTCSCAGLCTYDADIDILW